MKYVCKNCGAVGDAPSVKVAAQLPEGFVCPACGAGKSAIHESEQEFWQEMKYSDARYESER